MKRQAHSSHTLTKYSGGPNLKQQQHQLGIGLANSGFPNIEVQQKIEKIPTTFVFDRRIPPNDYKNYISIDDIYNENFEYARKLFEDPSRAFAVADYSSDHKIPRRLAQVNYKSYTAQEKKREKKVNFVKEKGQMNATVSGGSKFGKHEVSNNIYPPPPPSLQKQHLSSTKQKSQLVQANSLLSPQQSPSKQQHEDQFNFFKDISPLRQQSQVPDYIHENMSWNQQKTEAFGDQNQLQKSLIVSQTQIHQQVIPPSKDNLILQSTASIDQQKKPQTFSQQPSLFQKKNSFIVPATSANPSVLSAAKSTVALPQQNTQINNFTNTQSMKSLPQEKKASEDRVQGLIAQTREKVKRLQSYAEKLKRRVMQSRLNKFQSIFKFHQYLLKIR